jgi:hypothetical protein
MQPVRRLASALAILAALHGSAFAQAAGGQLSGRVTDETAGSQRCLPEFTQRSDGGAQWKKLITL